jgi:general secretion pathway protein G
MELVAGLALAAVLLGGVLLLVRPGIEADKADAGMRDAMRIREAALDWKQENPSGCPTLSQLRHEKHLAAEARTDDPWGQRFRLECTGEDVVIRSEGRDGKPGTEDDIRVPYSRG